AYDAAQVALTAADLLTESNTQAVFALCRPPGHHAHRDLCGGYCFFNNAAVATKYLIDVLKVGKVAILDVDYHHGNGTQAIFYNSPNPLYISLHGHPDYPLYLGSPSETGSGPGTNYNINIPLPIGTGDVTYLAELEKVIKGPLQEFEPNLLLVSLGVDTFERDPVGNFKLTSDCFLEMGKLIAGVGVKTLFVMEGGYDIPAIGRNVTNVLRGFE
ncbi:hypothetical protein HDV05_003299, partial [Chytridiales sp. JEL 0842]